MTFVHVRPGAYAPRLRQGNRVLTHLGSDKTTGCLRTSAPITTSGRLLPSGQVSQGVDGLLEVGAMGGLACQPAVQTLTCGDGNQLAVHESMRGVVEVHVPPPCQFRVGVPLGAGPFPITRLRHMAVAVVLMNEMESVAGIDDLATRASGLRNQPVVPMRPTHGKGGSLVKGDWRGKAKRSMALGLIGPD